ncbi:TetR/AcrR family transcriptional regulator [Mesorhizobium microcysteis]|uniref:TetR/AcrR family transcriptional regulator n=1 Tax=Neoaquamicrobium microcysteis TaxID=2682781 RepID=A0A5D4GRJ0_9HYPH|nr:TetR/AcrR family transcriptional regulator [Mesorhizobium microcysteis]TYR31376.1 TetR/AcrR family transcriptional regulator [Mesorhizobium microcysteis]
MSSPEKQARRSKGYANREAITAAAAGLFWREGYASTTLADVAIAANVPPGNLFYYFRTKADLARAVADVFVAETEAMLEATGADEGEPRRRLAALVARLSRSAPGRVAHGCLIALCVRDFRRDAPEASDRAAEAFAMLVGFMARELGRAGQRPSLALSRARAALAEWQGGIMLAHALKDASILSESFRRMERTLAG